MSAILDTVVSYEDKVVDLVRSAKEPVVEYVTKGVELAEGRIPEFTYPQGVPTPIEVLETQVAFVKKLIDANAELAQAVLTAIAPVAGYKVPARKAVKSAPKPAA
jgi:hypothetical protein